MTTQQDALRELDADLHAAFADSGLAGIAEYRAKGVPATDPATTANVRVFVNRDVQVVGDVGQILARHDEVEVLRADVDAPQKGATLLVDGERFELVDPVRRDESKTTWLVRRAAAV